jgi:hypothetical protein
MASTPDVKPEYIYVYIKTRVNGDQVEIHQAFSLDAESRLNLLHELVEDDDFLLNHKDLVARPARVNFTLRIENAEQADPPKRPKFKRTKCPECGKDVAVTTRGFLWPHNDPRGTSQPNLGLGFRCRRTQL